MSRKLILAIRVAIAGILSLSLQAAAAYPEKPITLIVPYSAGGPTDLAARTLAQFAPQYLGQPIVVLNKPGVMGVYGSQLARTSAPDGYTLLLARVGSQAISPAIDSTIPYKWNDFTFLSVLELNPTACVVRADAPYRSLGELVDYLKNNPGKVNYPSSGGDGNIPYMVTQLLFSLGGLDKNIATSIPYKSDGDSVTALLGGQVQFFCASLSAIISHIKSGSLRGLAVSMPERLREIPNVPTAREAGFPEMEQVVGWSALYGPPDLPKALVEKWAEVMKKVAQDTNWVAANGKFGGIPAVRSPAETEKYAREQYELYYRLITSLGIRK